MTRRVPVVVVAGFLGAGKTTLVNHLLASDARIGVVVNDFGEVSIDALLVAGSVDGAVTLGGGCICCTADSDSLTEVVGALTRPSARVDAVVIEASGIAEPAAIIRMILGSTDRSVVYGGMVYVLDAVEMDRTRVRHPHIDRHIALADLLVVNKTDLVDPRRAAEVVAHVRRLNATAAILPTSGARVDPAMVVDRRSVPHGADSRPRQLDFADLLAETESCDTHPHALYESVAIEAGRPLHPRRFAAFLERPPVGVYRIKGVVFFDVPGHRGRYAVHAVGGHVTVDRITRTRDDLARSHVIVIGTGMDAAQVRAVLESTVRHDEPVDASAMSPITRYERART